MDKAHPTEEKTIPISCHICGKHTTISGGFRYGTTLRKDPLNPGQYLCEKHFNQNKIPWRIKTSSEFRAFLSQFKNSKKKKKKIMKKMRKIRA